MAKVKSGPVTGPSMSHIFSIEVPPTSTIGDLREQIKQEQVVAAPLTFYSDDFDNAIFQLKLSTQHSRSRVGS